jgi:hypothetical protein
LAQLSEPAAVALVQQFVGIHVQGLDFKGRSACYQLLLEVLQVRPQLLLPPLLLLQSSWWVESAVAAQQVLREWVPLDG